MILNILQFITALITVYLAIKICKEQKKGKKISELRALIKGIIVALIALWIINFLIGYVI